MSVRSRILIIATSSMPALAFLYAALFGAFGMESPFFPSFLASRDLGSREIAAVLATGTIVRIVAGPAIGLLADIVGVRMVLAAASAGAGVLILLYLPTAGFFALTLLAAVHSLTISPLNPLCDALAVETCRREQLCPYGWVRGVGSFAFVLATISAGLLVARAGLVSVLVVSAGLFLMMLPALAFVPPAGMQLNKVSSRDAFALLRQSAFARMLFVASLVIGSQAMSDTVAVIHWRAHGLSLEGASLLWSEAVAAEIIVFLLVGPIPLRRFGYWRCATLSAGAGIVRWAIFAVSTGTFSLAIAQALQGMTFALMHLACMDFIACTVAARLAATAQSLYNALALGFAAAVLTLASGEAYHRFEGAAFWLMAVLCLLGSLIAAVSAALE